MRGAVRLFAEMTKMKRSGRKAWLVVPVFVVAALAATTLLLRAWMKSHTVETQYSTLAEATEAQLGRNGWLPAFIPETAYNIHEVHDLSTNMSWGSFSVNRESEPEMLARLSPVSPPFVLEAPRKPFVGWPLAGSGELCSDELSDTFVGLYHDDAPTKQVVRQFVVVILPATRQVVYWTYEKSPIRLGNCAKTRKEM